MYKEKFEGLDAFGEQFVESFFSYTPWSDELADNVCYLLDFCDGYEFEEEMAAYMAEHPKASYEELRKYFADNVPLGLPTKPGDAEALREMGVID